MQPDKKRIFKYLQKRGRKSNTLNYTIIPPSRLFKSIPEEIINLLYVAKTHLSVKEIANYMGFNVKSVSKSITKMFKSEITYQYIKKVRSGKTTYFRFVSQLPHDMDISGLWKVIRNDKRQQPQNKTSSITVQRIPFEGTLLHEECFLVSSIVDKYGCLKNIHTPLPIEVNVIEGDPNE